MSFTCALVATGLVCACAYIWYRVSRVPPVPRLRRTWWGKGEPTEQDEAIRPFKINVSDQILEDLAYRLKNHKPLTPPLEDKDSFEYGFNTAYLTKIIAFWRDSYHWRDRELFLNQFPHFKTRISGLDLHYIHVKPENVPSGVRVIPMMLLHGWPGSIREFYSLIPLMTKPRPEVDYVFEVIVPSLPGYGFSEAASKAGMGAAEVAVIMHNLMERIGHEKYYLQGGDWGSFIATNISILYPENIYGLHTNMGFVGTATSSLKTFLGSFYPSLVIDAAHAHLMYPFSTILKRLIEETGYMHLQATKPDTVGVGLTDSPIGLAAYILEKFSTGTNPDWRSLPDGGLTKNYTMTDLLDDVMIYWVTGSITSSMRFYKETFSKSQARHRLNNIPCRVPTGCAAFPSDFFYQCEYLLREKYPNMVRFTDMPRGGHFPAFEEPQMLADDIWTTVRIIEKKRKLECE